MLGFVMLSEYNELVHAFGNDEFRANFTAQPKETPPTAEVAPQCSTTVGALTRPASSSSSGVSSSTSTTSSAPHNFHSQSSKIAKKRNIGKMTIVKTDENRAEEERHKRLDEALLLQQLMPLVMLCRTKQQYQQQMVQRIDSTTSSSSSLHIRMANLPHSNLMALFHEESALSSSSAEHLFVSLRRCVLFHYGGPSLQLIPLQSAFIQILSRRCERRLARLLNGTMGKSEEANTAGEDETPFCQNHSFGSSASFIHHALLPQFRELAQRVADRIGRRCRCLFLHSGRLIATMSSHSGESTVAALLNEDLRSLLQFTVQPPDDDDDADGKANDRQTHMKCHVELGTWLYSKSIRRRQLHNVVALSLSDQVDMLCLMTAEHSQLISAIWQALELLDKFGNEFDNVEPSLLDRCDRQLTNAQKMLDILKKKGKFKESLTKNNSRDGENRGKFNKSSSVELRQQQQFTFVENIPRTQRLIQHHWNRFRSSINSYLSQWNDRGRSVVAGGSEVSAHRDPLHPPPHLPSHRLLLLSHLCFARQFVGSNLSVLSPSSVVAANQATISSVGSARPSTTVSGTSYSSSHLSITHLDAMRSQIKKVLRAVVDELLAWNHELARLQMLPLLQSAVHHSMGPQLSHSLARLDNELGCHFGCRDRVDNHGISPLRPAILGFDMLAYHFLRLGVGPPLHFHYITEDIQQKFNLLLAFDEDDNNDVSMNELDNKHENEGEAPSTRKNGGEELAFARTLDGELLIQIQTQFESKKTNTAAPRQSYESEATGAGGLLAAVMPFASRLRKVSRELLQPMNPGTGTFRPSTSYRCTVLFSRHTNTTLAVRQTSELIEILSAQMEQHILPNLH